MIRVLIVAGAIAAAAIGAAPTAVADGPYANCTQAHKDGRWGIPKVTRTTDLAESWRFTRAGHFRRSSVGPVDLAAVQFLGTQAPAMTLNSQFTVGPVTTPLVSISGSGPLLMSSGPGRVDGGHGGVLPAIGAAVVLVGHLLLSVAVEAVLGQDHAPGAATATVSVADAVTH